MSKADELRKKMGNRGAAQTFTPRPSVNVQPIPQPQEEKKPTPEPIKVAPKQRKPKAEPERDELVALFAKVPKDDKRWLDHHRIDEGKDLGEIVSEAIQLLRKQVEKR